MKNLSRILIVVSAILVAGTSSAQTQIGDSGQRLARRPAPVEPEPDRCFITARVTPEWVNGNPCGGDPPDFNNLSVEICADTQRVDAFEVQLGARLSVSARRSNGTVVNRRVVGLASSHRGDRPLVAVELPMDRQRSEVETALHDAGCHGRTYRTEEIPVISPVCVPGAAQPLSLPPSCIR